MGNLDITPKVLAHATTARYTNYTFVSSYGAITDAEHPQRHTQRSSHTAPKPRLRLIPLDDTVVFPNMGITLTIDVGDDKRVVLVPRHENEFLEVGTIAEVSEQIRLPGGGRAVALSGEHRALIGAAQSGPEGELRVDVDERPDEVPVDGRTRELESASTERPSRRSSSCAATTDESPPSCERSPSPERWPTRPATPPVSATSRRSSCCAPST